VQNFIPAYNGKNRRNLTEKKRKSRKFSKYFRGRRRRARIFVSRTLKSPVNFCKINPEIKPQPSRMKINSQISSEDFENLLAWFSPDRDEAGKKYEQVRQGLIRYFRYRGSQETEALADETINRVARKLHEFNFDKEVKLMTYFYSFASRIRLEELTEKSKRENTLASADYLESLAADDAPERKEEIFDCLDHCLKQLGPADAALVVEYYSRDKKEKIAVRNDLAARLRMKVSTLHTRVHRLRFALRDCIKQCREEKKL
jgi:DNA-directed RNA polymerase specialized sigma24 family protein